MSLLSFFKKSKSPERPERVFPGGQMPPPADWFADFRSPHFPFKNAGEFLYDWSNNRHGKRYISLVHGESQKTEIMDRIASTAQIFDGGVRLLSNCAASHQFFGQMPGGQRCSVRIDQRLIDECAFGSMQNIRVFGQMVTTFQIGRSPAGRMFGLHCAFAAMDEEMLLAIDQCPQGGHTFRYEFGSFQIRHQKFIVARSEYRFWHSSEQIIESFRVEYFNLPRTICLKLMDHYRFNTFLSDICVAEMKFSFQQLHEASPHFTMLRQDNASNQ